MVLKENLEKRAINRFNTILIDKNFENNFYLSFSGQQQNKKRWLRPDIIFEDDFKNNLFIRDMLDNDLLRKLEKSSDRLGVSGNVDITFEFELSEDINKEQIKDAKERFEKLYKSFSKFISDILNPSENQDRSSKTQKSLKPFIKQINISRNNQNSFIIKSMPKKMFHKIFEDILSQDKEKSDTNAVRLYDWKYISYEDFMKYTKENTTINNSIIKQLIYEFCLKNTLDRQVNNQFCVPYYIENANYLFDDDEMLDCGIGITKVNFQAVQAVYLNE